MQGSFSNTIQDENRGSLRKQSINFNRNLDQEKKYNTVSQRSLLINQASQRNVGELNSLNARKAKIFRIFDKHCQWPIDIRVPEEHVSRYNVDWLFDFYLKTMISYPGFDMGSVACLKTRNDKYNYDYVLTKPEVALDVFPDYIELEPYYGEWTTGTISLRSFKILRIIGTGGFATVVIVRKCDTGQIYAMKIVKKDILLKKEKEEYIFEEKRILTTIDNPFLVVQGLTLGKAFLHFSN